MILDTIIIFGVIILAILYFADSRDPKKGVLGIIAGVILLIMALGIYTEGIQIRTGETTSGVMIVTTSGNNTVSNGTIVSFDEVSNSTQLQTTNPTYVSLPAVPFVNYGQFLGLLLILVTIYLWVHYSNFLL